MNLLVVCHYFPPLNTVGAFRPWSWAKYWTRHGHRVTVVTTKKYSFDGDFDDTLRHEIDNIGVEVIEVPYLKWAEQRTNGVPGAAGPTDRFQPLIGWLKYLLRQTRRKILGPAIDMRRAWVTPAVQAAIDAHSRTPFDAIISTFGPPASHAVGFHLKRQTGVPWVADYRDLWADHPYTGMWPFSTMTRREETRLLTQADLITTTSEPWRETLAQRFTAPTATIANGFDAERMASVLPWKFPADGKKRILYTGTLYTHDRDPTPLFKAIELLRQRMNGLSIRLEVLFYGDLEHLVDLVSRYKLQDIVKVFDPVDLDRSLAMQKSANALLFVDWRERIEGFLTAKLFEYMNSGTPIFAIGGSVDQDASELIERTGTGIALGEDPDRIADALEDLICDRQIPFEPDWQFLSRYSRETLAVELLQLINDKLIVNP